MNGGYDIVSIVKSFGKNKSNIVFCESKKNAVNWARQYIEDMPDIDNEELNDLIKDISEDIHSDCYLTTTLRKGSPKDNKIVMIKNSLLKCPKVTEEVQKVKYNYRDLFNEKK